jgi:hypothetical protein
MLANQAAVAEDAMASIHTTDKPGVITRKPSAVADIVLHRNIPEIKTEFAMP